MAFSLKPENELIISGLGITIVYAIFALNTPNLADVRHDEPGNMNTYKSVNIATWTSVAVISALALLGKSHTVFVAGGVMTLFETWKQHYANFGAYGSQENAQAKLTGGM